MRPAAQSVEAGAILLHRQGGGSCLQQRQTGGTDHCFDLPESAELLAEGQFEGRFIHIQIRLRSTVDLLSIKSGETAKQSGSCHDPDRCLFLVRCAESCGLSRH